MSSSQDSRRRPRSEIEDDDEADNLRASLTPSSDSSKRARTGNGALSDSPRQNGLYDDDDDDDEEVDGENDAGAGGFQQGAIVRVKLTNFVTYESAEFFPGPNLNMVIGPNGTGKSSLVCAICLGLGWGPQHLGRAQGIGEFVKHNTSEANVEIELQRREGENSNHVVRLKITKDNNGREFYLNDRKSSHKAIQALTKSFNIQVDNLCQFLPQDKVSEFAALSPVDLLIQTQRAAAPEEMLEQHESLKQLRKEQKSLDQHLERDQESLAVSEKRQNDLRGEVQKLEERQAIEETISVLTKTIPFVEYRAARNQHIEFRDKKKKAQKCLRDLEAELAPTLESIKKKERYVEQITAAVRDRKSAVDRVERDAGAIIRTIEGIDDNIKEHKSKIESEEKEQIKQKNDYRERQRNITNLKARLNDEKVVFNGPEWNERIRAKVTEVKNAGSGMNDLKSQKDELLQNGRAAKATLEEAKQELAAFDTQEGQQSALLRSFSKETAEAWEWVQANAGQFEKEVYGPPLISCSVKDPRYTDAIESLFREPDYLTITAQTPADHKKLSDHILGTMGFALVPIRRSDGDGLNDAPVLSSDEMQRLGLDGWALDFIDGPDTVRSMLAGSKKLHTAAIALKDVTDQQLEALGKIDRLSNFVAGGLSYTISRRREYGPSAVSTRTSTVSPAKHWTNQPVDTSGKIEIQTRIDSLQVNFQGLKDQMGPLNQRIQDVVARVKDVETELEQMRNEKNAAQKAHGEYAALPTKIEREEETLREKKQGFDERRNRIKSLQVQIDSAALKKAQSALEYKDHISQIRTCHEELLEAEIRLIEAKSDHASLNDRNAGIGQRLAEEEQNVATAEQESARVREIAARALEVCKEIQGDPANADYVARFQKVDENETVERLESEIAAEEAKLEFIHANNPNAIRDFEKRQVDIDKLKEKISDAEERLESIGGKITTIRGKWEPALDSLISEISDAFSYNFEQIGCAGEVSIHKDEDFDLWAIQIKVKFRENETLQLLNAHRQSGGERSVSTIFYLMSLQSLARAPFRVVDEINQGMDPRNERMVHERMVEIACKEHTSQYFLITPKLLTGLRYDKKMKVLCIASGEHMPDNYKKLDISKILGIRRAMVAAG
ncbi:Structural maintenance of chromosomes protein [Lachnellula suecica]|uniref:Structural maintenance of chromosomes protein 5 n=1 Tax=Lachnellula suecica TaxID=602035 RepID=A0A8T9CGB5_9HELO|nr:Structural maintenance of chromosomes protein [Lachnellula suecica]